jgi:LuxR family maltose regulon positive regulatory protein
MNLAIQSSMKGTIERLKEGLNYNLVIVSAPAGFGKTTLLSEWTRISQPQIRTAWVSLDDGDNDPTRFWAYVIAALQGIQPDVGTEVLAAFRSPQLPPAEAVLPALINELAAMPHSFALVLDDYHVIETETIHAGISFLIDHIPPKMHLVMAARADPDLPLARFRGRGVMLKVGPEDLRFTLDETAALMTPPTICLP